MKPLRRYLCASLLLGLLFMAACDSTETLTDPIPATLDTSQGLLNKTAATCSAPAWDPNTAYNKNDIVSHNNNEWKAKKANQGVEPGTNPSKWTDLGPCGDDPPSSGTPMQIFGAWHCGNHYCDWSILRDMTAFDQANHWLIDRNGDGTLGDPSVNLVILSFLQPMQVLNKTNDAITVNGVPIGMSQDVVAYFKDQGIRVMMSIGGITYADFWDEALATNATQFGLNAAEIATNFGVGIEIDYERATDPNLDSLQAFVDAYRSVHAYDATGANHAARFTIDLAVGNRYLQALSRKASTDWLQPDAPVLDYANAMVPGQGQPTTDQWQEHIDGKPQYNPPIPPKAPSRFAGAIWLTRRKNPIAECLDFANSTQNAHATYVQTVTPNPAGPGVTNGMLGMMFWAAECPSTRNACTIPPNTCEGGLGVAAATFNIPIPMPPLRQE